MILPNNKLTGKENEPSLINLKMKLLKMHWNRKKIVCRNKLNKLGLLLKGNGKENMMIWLRKMKKLVWLSNRNLNNVLLSWRLKLKQSKKNKKKTLLEWGNWHVKNVKIELNKWLLLILCSHLLRCRRKVVRWLKLLLMLIEVPCLIQGCHLCLRLVPTKKATNPTT